MFKPGEVVVLRHDLKLARQQRGEAAAATRSSRYTIVSVEPGWTYKVRFPDGEEKVLPEADICRVPPNLPVIKEDGKPETEFEKTCRLMGINRGSSEGRELRWKLEEKLGDVPVVIEDWRGHFKDGAYWTTGHFYKPANEVIKQMLSTLLMMPKPPGPEETQALIDAIESGTPLPEPISIGSAYDFKCPYCGATLTVGCDGTKLVILGDPCTRPEGLDTTEWELNVPSGKLVVANDLREWFPCDKDYDINSLIGTHLQQLAYAAVGMSHGFVGNSCPSVYRFPDGTLSVANSPNEELWVEDEDGEYHDEPNPHFKEWEENNKAEAVASVCTDLWWYSIVDLDEFNRRVAHYTPDLSSDDLAKYIKDRCDIVDVEPGVYRFTHFNEGDRDAPEGHTYCRIERVRDPDPLTNYIKADDDKELPADIVLAQSIRSWPTLYLPPLTGDANYEERKPFAVCTPQEKASAIAGAANQIMCVNGNGIDWHPNGFPRMIIEKGTKPVQIPPFDFRYGWYELSPGYSTITRAAGLLASGGYRSEPEPGEANMHPSYVLLALNICQSIISYGLVPHLNNRVYPPAYEIGRTRRNMVMAAKSYRALRKRYPDLVFDQTFDDWMAAGRSKQWIEDFDLGPEHTPQETWGPPPETQKQGDYFEFNANLIEGQGHFAWHPRNPGVAGCWARKEDAQRYAIDIHQSTTEEYGEVWYSNAGQSIPLRCVGRVVGPAQGQNVGPLLEVRFEYGTEQMQDQTVRWGFPVSDLKAVRQFSDRVEYLKLLDTCKAEYDAQEAEMDQKVAEYAAL